MTQGSIAVVGAGAMGAAMASLHVRAGHDTVLVGTAFDTKAIEACRNRRPHPALGIALEPAIGCASFEERAGALGDARRVVIAVSSEGLANTVADIAGYVAPDADLLVVTKGWDPQTLRSPSEVITDELGDRPFSVLGGPALAPELVAGVPALLVCASPRAEVAESVASDLHPAGISIGVTDDVAGVEVGAAYKNVTAIAVGMCEGLAQQHPEHVFAQNYANARASAFALGLQDMERLALARGGRTQTVLGPAGAGDLYVTCLGGRNGRFGRLVGAGETPDQALKTLGSTVEGVSNTTSALEIARRHGVDLAVARTVDEVLSGRASVREAIGSVLGPGGL